MRRSVVAPLALLLPLTACRFDFDPVPAAAKPTDAGPDAAPPLPVLACGAPPLFTISVPAGVGSGSGAPTLAAIAATASADGYNVLAVDTTGEVQGFGFAFNDALLAPRATGTAVFSGATGVLAATDTPDGVLAAIEYDSPIPTGTALVALDTHLAPLGTQQKDTAWFSLDDTLAHTADGKLAFIGTQSGVTMARRVSASATDLSGSQQIVDPAEGASVPTIAGAGANFLVTWVDTPPDFNLVRAEVLDANLSVIAGPATINPTATHDGENPRGAYAASADVYLFAWSFKTSVTDELWVSLRDNQLRELRAIQVSMHGVQPRVIAGKDDFLVAWKDTNTSSSLGAARVRFDGSIVPLVVSGNGGKALGWDLATRAGQPALVWVENALAPGLWLDPLCK
ncbi:MAG TPA: hypothetical protein VHT91_28515 [Kofleriaceae bacterium]|nr:hypothetical protein [Kofleriaceae bacterium]